MCTQPVIKIPLLGHGKVCRIRRVEAVALDEKGPDAGIFDFFEFFRFAFGHVTRSTAFADAHVTSTATNCKDERQINPSLRTSSGVRRYKARHQA